MNGERGISQIVGIGFGALFALVAFVIVYTYEPSAAGVPVETRASGDSTFEPMQTGGGSFETEKTGAESGGSEHAVEVRYAPASGGSPAAEAEELIAEIRMATGSGGVNRSRYDAIVKELEQLAVQGLDQRTLETIKTMREKMVIGGSEPVVKKEEPPPPREEAPRVETRPFWEYDPSQPEKGWYWARDGAPPECAPNIVLEAPVDLNLVTGILYPGQVRGTSPLDFKPHGGFQLKAGTKSVAIRAPMDGYLVSVAKFTDEFGLHYGLTFTHPCGIAFGGGHFGALPPDIQAIVDTIPMKGYRESTGTEITPPHFVKKGDVIVTGLQEGGIPERPGFDWGVADYREPNAASKDARFRELYGYAPWNTYYGVCWLDWLPAAQQSIVRSLPGVDGKQGKNSEYCK